MSIIACILLGILQGITEILPVSSTFHISKFLSYVNFENKVFTELINIGSLLSIYLFFMKDYNSAIKGFFRYIKNIFNKKHLITKDEYNFIKLFMSSVPSIILLGIFNCFTNIHDINDYSIWIGICSAIFLIISDIFFDERNQSLHNLKIVTIIGLSQVFAIFQGFSRLGACILIMRILKFERKKAFMFSLFISLPVNTANVLFHILSNVKESLFILNDIHFFIVLLVSSVIGFFTIKVFQNLIKKYTFTLLSIYKILVMLCIK